MGTDEARRRAAGTWAGISGRALAVAVNTCPSSFNKVCCSATVSVGRLLFSASS